MGKNQNSEHSSRRDFFSRLLSKNKNPEKVKMLTADGKLVEVDKTIFDQLTRDKKASNKEIYDWMENPCKKEDNF
jgi:hypothetical protein